MMTAPLAWLYGTDPRVVSPLDEPEDDLMADEKIEQLLRDFLIESRIDKAKGYTNEALHEALSKVVDKFNDHVQLTEGRYGELRGEIKGLGLRLAVVEKDIEILQKDADITGEHLIADLKAQLTKAQEALEREARAKQESIRAKAESVHEIILTERTETRKQSLWFQRTWAKALIGVIAAVLTVALTILVSNALQGKGADKALPAHEGK